MLSCRRVVWSAVRVRIGAVGEPCGALNWFGGAVAKRGVRPNKARPVRVTHGMIHHISKVHYELESGSLIGILLKEWCSRISALF
jgi:hypothetical protein